MDDFRLELHHGAGKSRLEFHPDRPAHLELAVHVSGKPIVAAIEAVSHDCYVVSRALLGHHADRMVAVLTLRTAFFLRRCGLLGYEGLHH